MAQVNTMAEGSARLNPCSPQNITSWQAQRLQSAWLYKGPDSAKIPGLTTDQLSYAITLRRMMVLNLFCATPPKTRAPVFSDEWQRNSEWNTIRTALKREVSRCDRAHKRLAAKKAVAA